jgi:hypothetical protein
MEGKSVLILFSSLDEKKKKRKKFMYMKRGTEGGKT